MKWYYIEWKGSCTGMFGTWPGADEKEALMNFQKGDPENWKEYGQEFAFEAVPVEEWNKKAREIADWAAAIS